MLGHRGRVVAASAEHWRDETDRDEFRTSITENASRSRT